MVLRLHVYLCKVKIIYMSQNVKHKDKPMRIFMTCTWDMDEVELVKGVPFPISKAATDEPQ